MKIRADVIRTYQKVHTWTGIIAGLFLFIGFYAGSLTMFKPAIEKWAVPKSQIIAQTPIDEIDQLVLKATHKFDKVKQGFIIEFNEYASSMKWYESGGGRGLRLDDELVHASLNENQQVETQQATKNVLGTLIDQLHRTAGIPGSVGHEDLGVLVLGIAAGLYFLALISGVIFLLPTLVKSLFSLRKNKGSGRFWLDSHNLVGVMSLPFHIIIAWTAVVFALHDPFYGGLSVAYGDKPLFERGEKSEHIYQRSELPKIKHYIDTVKTIAPEHTLKSLDFSGLDTTSPSVAIEVQTQKQMMRGGYSDIIFMNPYTMTVSYSSVLNEKSNAYTPIVKTFFGLHFGNYAGDLGRWIYFIMGLMGAFLFYSGNLLWLEKRRIKQPQQQKSSKVMAALTVSVSFGSILGVVATLVATKWLYLFTQVINTSYLYIYYCIFIFAIILSFVTSAAFAAIHLQRLIAYSCAGIPFTSLLLSQNSNAIEFTTSNISLNLVASLFAVFFYLAANKTKQRALTGDKNSVWALDNISKAKQAEYITVK